MKEIQLTQGKVAKVDDEDFEWLSEYKWHLHSGGYASTKINGRPVLMHRLIMDTPEGMDTDHINHDCLDNRRTNLKVCTHKENMNNRWDIKGGIVWESRRGHWVVRIQHRKKRVYYGSFDNKEQALATLSKLRQELNGV